MFFFRQITFEKDAGDKSYSCIFSSRSVDSFVTKFKERGSEIAPNRKIYAQMDIFH